MNQPTHYPGGLMVGRSCSLGHASLPWRLPFGSLGPSGHAILGHALRGAGCLWNLLSIGIRLDLSLAVRGPLSDLPSGAAEAWREEGRQPIKRAACSSRLPARVGSYPFSASRAARTLARASSGDVPRAVRCPIFRPGRASVLP